MEEVFLFCLAYIDVSYAYIKLLLEWTDAFEATSRDYSSDKIFVYVAHMQIW